MDWRDKAACLDEDPELFFPIGTTGRALDQIEEAKAVCAQCPVIQECLEWALDTKQDAGVWGGKSEEERRTLRRKRGRRGKHVEVTAIPCSRLSLAHE
ncbi:MAG: WhiB family transcriptional regulator [Egibacteraceae bacterium]